MRSAAEKRILASILVFFSLVFASVSLVNHFLYKTHALDLGMFNHALWDFAHLRLNYFTLNLWGETVNYFGDHFSPVILLFSPLVYLFGSYTLLLVQIAFVLWGGYGVFLYTEKITGKTQTALWLIFGFFGFFALYSALAFDFHTNVIAAMALPWLLLSLEKKNKRAVLLWWLFILLCKENMGLWLVFIFAGHLLQKKLAPLKEAPVFFTALILVSAIWFFVCVGVLMPYLSDGKGTQQMARYAALGNNFSEIFSTLFNQPRLAFSLLFESPLPDAQTFGIKSELYYMLLLSGGIGLLLRPLWLIMLIPVFAQKMWTNDFTLWGISQHYSVEFAPVVFLSLANSLEHNTVFWSNRYLLPALMLAVHVFNIASIDYRRSLWYSKEKTCFYCPQHYSSVIDPGQITDALQNIPDTAAVSCHSNLAPRLAFRKKIYHFPVLHDATYIAVFRKDMGTYPMNEPDYTHLCDSLASGPAWQKVYDANNLLILKRR